MTSLRWLTAGESHGKGLTIIVEGMPAGPERDKNLKQLEDQKADMRQDSPTRSS